LTKDIDEDDTPFIALGIELNAKLWTGDKVLSKGLAKKGVDIIITTADLKNSLNKVSICITIELLLFFLFQCYYFLHIINKEFDSCTFGVTL
jgi:predicted nucleic acid-binding protein